MKRAALKPPGLLRATLLEKLTAVAPALADGTVPILNHLWFTGTELVAFNDTIAVSVPHEAPFTGALPGKLLIDFVKTISRDEVLFEPHENGVKLTAPGSSMRAVFPVLPPEDFVFDWPDKDLGPLAAFQVDADLRDAMKAALRSVGKGGNYPETHGLTMVASESKLLFYGTDAQSITRALAPNHSGENDRRAILPTLFCQQLVKRPDEGGELYIYPNYAEYISPEYKLFGRVRAAPEPLDFDTVMEKHVPASSLKAAVAIPGNLAEMLARSYVITKDEKPDTAKVTFTVADGALSIDAGTERGSNRDRLKFVGHPNVEARFRPHLIHKALGDFERVVITQRAMALVNPTVLYLISSTS